MNIQLLLIGFNRIDLLEKRLRELQDVNVRNIFVSIDFHSEHMSNEFTQLLDKYKNEWNQNTIFNYRILEKNAGLGIHISELITQNLQEFDGVIVVEDDISITEAFVSAAHKYLASTHLSSKYFAFCGYSAIKLPNSLKKMNFIRRTPYFASWGWATNRENWANFELDLSSKFSMIELEKSGTWQTLSQTQKEIWNQRFAKIMTDPFHTWDIQMQYLAFTSGKYILSPIGRSVENEGFHDSRSAHTQSHRPKWMGNFGMNKYTIIMKVMPKFLSKPIEFYESLTLIGDNSRYLVALKKILRR